MEIVVRLEKIFNEEDGYFELKYNIIQGYELLKKICNWWTGRTLSQQGMTWNLLRALFRNHREFYEFIGFSYDTEHHPGDNDFKRGCNGFRRFMMEHFGTEYYADFDEEQVNKLQQIITSRIEQLLKEYERARNTRIETTATINVIETEENDESVDLAKLDIKLNDAIIITNSKAFKLQLIPVKNVKSFDDLISEATNSLHNMYKLQLQAKVSALQSEIQKLREEVKKARSEAFILGLKTYKQVNKLGWKIENDYLIYDKKIVCTHVKKDNRVYKLPNDVIEQEKFYVQEIKIKTASVVTEATARRAYHCNINYNGKICLGDLEGKDLLTVLQKLPETLKTLNLDSAYSNDARDELEEIVEQLEETAETAEVVWAIEED